MWKNIFLIVTACIFIVIQGKSQAGFIPGYIIKPNGDTLSGYIKNQNGSLNSKEVIFEKDRNGEQTYFSHRIFSSTGLLMGKPSGRK